LSIALKVVFVADFRVSGKWRAGIVKVPSGAGCEMQEVQPKRYKSYSRCVIARHELGDCYIEQINEVLMLPPCGVSKYDVSRELGVAPSMSNHACLMQREPLRLFSCHFHVAALMDASGPYPRRGIPCVTSTGSRTVPVHPKPHQSQMAMPNSHLRNLAGILACHRSE